jgi:O-antigen/teichoic acid export membrane protein
MVRRSAIRNSAFMLAGQVIGKGGFLASFMILSRYMNDRTFGVLALAVALGQILFFVSDMGVSIIVNRRLSIDPAGREATLRHAAALRTALCLAGMVLLGAGSVLVIWNRLAVSMIMMVGLGCCLESFTELSFAVFRSAERMGGEGAARAVGGLTGITGVVAVAMLDLGPFAAASVYALRTMVSFCAALFLLRRVGASLLPAFDRRGIAGILRESWPLGLMGLLMVAWQRIDNVVVSYNLGPAAVGAWQECYRILDTLVLVITPTLLPGALFPGLCRAYESSREQFERYMRGVAQLVTGLAILSSLFVLSGGLDLLRLLWGPGYLREFPLVEMKISLLLVGASIPIVFWMNFLLASMLATGRQKTVLAIAGAGLSASLVTNIVLLPRLGIVAPAVAVTVSSIVLCALLYAALRAGRPFRIFGQIWRASVPVVPAMAALYLLRGQHIVPRVGATVLVFAAAWIALGGIRPLLRRSRMPAGA